MYRPLHVWLAAMLTVTDRFPISCHALKVHGPARILGVANGDPSSHEPDFPVSPQRARRTTFNGLARLIVQVCRMVDIGYRKLPCRVCICSGLVLYIA